mgnify:CR=1 FL=1
MKKLLSLFFSLLLTGCAAEKEATETTAAAETAIETAAPQETVVETTVATELTDRAADQ